MKGERRGGEGGWRNRCEVEGKQEEGQQKQNS